MIWSRLKTTAGLRQECPQDSEFDGGQAQRRAGELRDMLLRIDRQLALGQRRRLLCVRAACHAAQDDVDAGDEFARAERLGDVIVAADLEAEHTVDFVVPRRKKQDRNVGGLANFAADVQSVEFGHADIQDDEIGPVAGETRQRFAAVPAPRSRSCRPSGARRG